MRWMLLLILVSGQNVFADEKRFPEASFGKGELKYIEGVPVAVLTGNSDEIGQQFGELVLKPAKKPLIERVDSYMAKIGWEKDFPKIVKLTPFVFKSFPKNNQEEMIAASKKAGVEWQLMTALNLIPDLAKLGGCSTLIVEPERSATGKPIFGRNLDWPPFEQLPEHSLIVVFRATGKHQVACVTFPVLLGCLSGMNDAGLCLTINEIRASKDGSSPRNVAGVPMMMLFRQILEECTTLDEAEKMLKAADRTTYFSLTACDTKQGCVFETTTKNVVRRTSIENVCCCTNHFRSTELSVTTKCNRYPKLESLQQNKEKLGVSEVMKGLHAVNQGDNTVQAMVFEPANRIVHVAFGGKESATTKPYVKLDLTKIFDKK